jgi:hypothetical protein
VITKLLKEKEQSNQMLRVAKDELSQCKIELEQQ